MKKIIIASTALLMLAGCSNYSTGVKDGSTPLATYKDTTLVTNDFYTLILQSKKVYSQSMILAYNAIGDAELDANALAVKIEADYQAVASSAPDIETKLKEAGYEGIDDFKASYIKPEAIKKMLHEAYLVSHKEALLTTYKFRNVRELTFPNEEVAKLNLQLLKEGGVTWEQLLTQFQPKDIGLVYKGSTALAEDVLKKVLASEKGIVDELFVGASDAQGIVAYKLYEVTELDPTILDATITPALEKIEKVKYEAMMFFFDKYKLAFHDATLQDQFEIDYTEPTTTK